MLTRKVRIQIVLFVLIALVGVAYTGGRYARLFGSNGYIVKMDLVNSGGIFSNAEVTYRGQAIGRVAGLRLTPNGVEVALNIDSSAPKIPSNTDAVVADRSAVGEQYVDLRPRAAGAPYLADGSVIPQERTTTPLPTQTLLTNVDNLATSVPTDDLRTVVNELDTAFSGTGQPLQQLLDTASAFTKTATEHVPQSNALLSQSVTVLDTQHKESGNIKEFSKNLELIAQQLKTSDPDIRKLIVSAPSAATQLNGVLQEDGTNLGLVIGNLLSTATLLKSRNTAQEQLLASAPALIPGASTVLPGDGKAHLGLTLDMFDPMVCTRGYGGTQQRAGNDTSAAQANTKAYCAEPPTSPTDVRGSQNAPHGAKVGAPPQQQDPGSSGQGDAQQTGQPTTVQSDSPRTLGQLMGLSS